MGQGGGGGETIKKIYQVWSFISLAVLIVHDNILHEYIRVYRVPVCYETKHSCLVNLSNYDKGPLSTGI